MKHVDVARTAVDGLLLRKTEIERDCIKKSDGGQPWNLKQFKVSEFSKTQLESKLISHQLLRINCVCMHNKQLSNSASIL